MKTKKPLHIVKIGGNIIDNDAELNQFLVDFNLLDGDKILVHGGGKSASKMAQSLGLEPKMIDGRRITDDKMLEVVVMMYAGWINKSIVAKLQSLKCNAVGLCGADGNSIEAEKRKITTVDYGFVGDITKVNSAFIINILNQNSVPVFSAITHDKNGQLLNTNADTIASELAIALAENFEVSLWYCFEKQGVLSTIEDENSVIEKLDLNLYEQLKSNKNIHSGMIPKLDNSFNSLSKGVQSIKIGHHQMLQKNAQKHTTLVL
jgi:acetylglutamate kinase